LNLSGKLLPNHLAIWQTFAKYHLAKICQTIWQSGKNLTPPIYLYFIGEQLGY